MWQRWTDTAQQGEGRELSDLCNDYLEAKRLTEAGRVGELLMALPRPRTALATAQGSLSSGFSWSMPKSPEGHRVPGL